MKKSLITFLLTVLLSMIRLICLAHDIEAPNADGVTIYYKWANTEKTNLVVTYEGMYSGQVMTEYVGNVVIPESVEYNGNNYPVTSIDHKAFQYSGVTSVTIPNSVTSIGQEAFDHCIDLATIVSEIKTPFDAPWGIAASSVTLIVPVGSKSAYKYASGWMYMTHIVEMGEGGLSGSRFGKDGIYYTIGENNTAFISGSSSLSIPCVVEIQDQMEFNGKKYDITSIGEKAFYGCSNLLSVTIGENITSIGFSAFYDCSSLTSVVIGSNVLSIGNNAFYGTNLKKIIWLTESLPSGYKNVKGKTNYVLNYNTYISNMVVYKNLNSLFVVDGIKYVPISSSDLTCVAIDCTYDSSIENINIGETVNNNGISMTVKEVNPYTCYWNKHIKNLKLNLRGDIGDFAFVGCENLEKIEFGGEVSSIGTAAFSGCHKLKNLDIPDAVTSLGISAFSGCTNLQSISIGSGVTSIGNEVFRDCQNLNNIYCKVEHPENIEYVEGVFEGLNIGNVILHVPHKSIELYFNSSIWSGFKDVIALDFLKGDANGDKVVDEADISEVANAILGEPSKIFDEDAADVNGDEIINTIDIVKILKIIKDNK